MNLSHSFAQRLLLLSQSLLLFAECFLFLSEFLLRKPELADAIDRSLVANDVGFLVALEPDEIALNLFSKFFGVVSVFGRP